MWIIAKIAPAVNWPGLAYSALQLLKTRGALALVAPLSYVRGLSIVILFENCREKVARLLLYSIGVSIDHAPSRSSVYTITRSSKAVKAHR